MTVSLMSLELTRRAVLYGAVTSAAIAPVSRPVFAGNRLQFAGVNLAGAEFGKVPGTYDTDYTYPASDTIDYFAQLGFNLIRLPFRWERLQPTLYAPFSAVELTRLLTAVNYAMAKGLHVVLDTHNFARRRVAEDGWLEEYLIGSAEVPSAAFADYCSRLAKVFNSTPSIIFGLMNEPWGLPAERWLSIANEAIAAIRREGADQLVLVPGIAYTGAHSWMSEGNAAMGNATDPANNMAFEVHQYFDEDSSGTSPVAMNARIGSERIEEFQRWARRNRVRAFLGEFGAAPNDIALQAMDDLCQTLAANADVWLGWAAWAGGGYWPEDYDLSLDPTKDGRMRPQVESLTRYARQIGGGFSVP